MARAHAPLNQALGRPRPRQLCSATANPGLAYHPSRPRTGPATVRPQRRPACAWATSAPVAGVSLAPRAGPAVAWRAPERGNRKEDRSPMLDLKRIVLLAVAALVALAAAPLAAQERRLCCIERLTGIG